MNNYLQLLSKVLKEGVVKNDRTGTGTRSLFGERLEFDLRDGFPLLTSKKVHLKSVIHELLWFIRGSTDNNELVEHGVRIWNEWALAESAVIRRPVDPMIILREYANKNKLSLADARSALNQHYVNNLKNPGAHTSWLREQGIQVDEPYRTIEAGQLGPIYGAQWRSWPCPNGETVDQLTQVLAEMKANPDSRRLVVSAWNPAVLPMTGVSPQENVINGRQALPACHTMFQLVCYPLSLKQRLDLLSKDLPAIAEAVLEDLERGRHDEVAVEALLAERKIPQYTVNLHLYQRSGDIFLGVPFNVASYALLLMMIAQHTGYQAGRLVISFGDLHLYSNHEQQACEQLTRTPTDLPTMLLNPNVDNVFKFTYDDFRLVNYNPQPAIPAPVAV